MTPTIYDVAIENLRAVTQNDVDKLVEAVQRREETLQQLRAACVEYIRGDAAGRALSETWRCRLCQAFGFHGPESVGHAHDCILGKGAATR